MLYRTLGNSDINASVIGLGANNFGGRLPDKADCFAVIDAALDAGINFIDTSNDYARGKSEEILGEAFAGRRDKAFIATKFNLLQRGDEPVGPYIIRCCEESLARLNMDYVDLYQMHWPIKNLPAEAVLEPLAKLVEEGKVRYAGECNFAAWRHDNYNMTAKHGGLPEMVSAQHNYNILNRNVELEVLAYCAEANVGFLPYYPLGAGYLTGKYKPGADAPAGTRGASGHREVGRLRTDRNEALLEPLTKFAEDRGHTLLELAFAYVLANPATTSVIAGAMNPGQIAANAATVDWHLTHEEWSEVAAIAGWDTDKLAPERESM